MCGVDGMGFGFYFVGQHVSQCTYEQCQKQTCLFNGKGHNMDR